MSSQFGSAEVGIYPLFVIGGKFGPEAAYIIPFLNVYAAPNADDYLIVDVNGGYHKAVISENVKDSDTVFDFKKTEESINDRFEVNPENATQLLWGGLSSNV